MGSSDGREHVAVIGTGAMAIVCARLLCDGGHAVRLWGHSAATAEQLARTRRRDDLLPGVTLPDTADVTWRDEVALDGPTVVVSAVPAQYVRSVWTRLRPHVRPGVPIVSVAKGIETGTLLRPTEVLREVLREVLGGHSAPAEVPLAVLSGPNIAAEIARGLVATAVAASHDLELARRVQRMFSGPTFRVYTNPDPLGVELAGATKNIIAIAAGILDGMNAGNNAKAALVTRGLVEITRLGVALGARPETFQGLAGLGDLITTCVAPEGRNRSLGEKIGRGLSLRQALEGQHSVVEGVATTRSVLELARRTGVDMPITETLHAILFDGLPAREGLLRLMSREPKPEASSLENAAPNARAELPSADARRA